MRTKSSTPKSVAPAFPSVDALCAVLKRMFLGAALERVAARRELDSIIDAATVGERALVEAIQTAYAQGIIDGSTARAPEEPRPGSKVIGATAPTPPTPPRRVSGTTRVLA